MTIRTPKDPAAERTPVARRVAQATVPGEPAVPGAPHGTAGGKTSLPAGQRSPHRTEGGPVPGTAGADPAAASRLPAPAGRGRTRAPAGGVIAQADAPSAGSTGRTFTIALPAGMKLLSLNGREHWSERARRTEALKTAAWAVAHQAKIPMLDRVSVVVEYQPPDRRRRDAENTCAASGKAAIDGIVAAGLLEDDACPRYIAEITCRIGELYPRGRLVLHLTELPPLVAAGGAA